ncbi:MAG: hypothetical protein LIP10_07660 [Clostridiales bacterium]|nr:hypothetical protein [Clostridiales bacterium]
MVTFNVVLVTYKNLDRSIKFIDDFLSFTNIKPGCIVVVDNSMDNFYFEGLRKHFFNNANKCTFLSLDTSIKKMCEIALMGDFNSTKIVIAQSNSNLMYAGGNNLGFCISQSVMYSKYILFSNDDVLFHNNYIDIRKMLTIFNEDSSVGIVGPKVVGLDGKDQSPFKYTSIYKRIIFPNIIYPFKLPSNNNLIHLDKCSYVYRVVGAFMIVDSDKFSECSMFDSDSGLYSEEQILSEKMLCKGYKTFYNPDVLVIHEEGGSSGDGYLNFIRKSIRLNKSSCYYFRKYKNVNRIIFLLARASVYLYVVKYVAVHFLTLLLGRIYHNKFLNFRKYNI